MIENPGKCELKKVCGESNEINGEKIVLCSATKKK